MRPALEPAGEVGQRAAAVERARHRVRRPQAARGQLQPVAAGAEGGQRRLAQAEARIVQPPLEVAQRARGIDQHAAAGRPQEALALGDHRAADHPAQPAAEIGQRVGHRALLLHHQLGGVGGRGGAHVGDEVGDREVHLVADRRDHRDLGGGDRAGQHLVVERPQVLERAAPPSHDDHVDAAERVELADALGHLGGGAVALDAGRRQHDVDLAEALADDPQHVADGGAAGRGHDADLAREPRQRALAARVEEALGRQPLLELLEGQLQGAEATRLQQLDHQLVLAALRVDLDGAERHHVQAVGRLEADAPHAVAKEHRAQLRRLVLEREVRVARAVHLEVGDLALDPHRREPLLHHRAELRRQRRHAEHTTLGAHDHDSTRSGRTLSSAGFARASSGGRRRKGSKAPLREAKRLSARRAGARPRTACCA